MLWDVNIVHDENQFLLYNIHNENTIFFMQINGSSKS